MEKPVIIKKCLRINGFPCGRTKVFSCSARQEEFRYSELLGAFEFPTVAAESDSTHFPHDLLQIV